MTPRATLLFLLLLAALVPFGCAAKVPQLNSDLTDAQIQERLNANFHPGMTLDQVNNQLDALNVSDIDRRAYAGDPPQLLVRLFPVGGYWVTNPYQQTRYVDTWFIFKPQQQTLVAIDLVDRVMRVEGGTFLDPPFQSPQILPDQPREAPAGAGSPGTNWITVGGIP